MSVKSLVDSVDPSHKPRNLLDRKAGYAEPYALVLMEILMVPMALLGVLCGLIMNFPVAFNPTELVTWFGGGIVGGFVASLIAAWLSMSLPIVETIIVGIVTMFIDYFRNPPFTN